MDPLPHTPQTKTQIREMLFEYLYAPVKDHLKRKLETIITENGNCTGDSYPGFLYRERIFMIGRMPRRGPKRWPRLHPSLRPEMEAYLQEERDMNEYEIPFVLNTLTQILNASNNVRDYLAILPESVHKPLLELIASSGYRVTDLPPAKVAELQVFNAEGIALIKQRKVLNLLL